MACCVLSAEKRHHQPDAADSSDGSSDVGGLRPFLCGRNYEIFQKYGTPP